MLLHVHQHFILQIIWVYPVIIILQMIHIN